MANKQFNQHDEYKGHYYEGAATIAENLIPNADPVWRHESEDQEDNTDQGGNSPT